MSDPHEAPVVVEDGVLLVRTWDGLRPIATYKSLQEAEEAGQRIRDAMARYAGELHVGRPYRQPSDEYLAALEAQIFAGPEE